MCRNPVPHILRLAGHSWSQGGHTSNLMSDSKSAQNFGIVTWATIQLLHVLLLAGHSWSQGGHRSNLMPDLESVQNFGSVKCATTQLLYVLHIAGPRVVTCQI